jgi:hypothetical protein
MIHKIMKTTPTQQTNTKMKTQPTRPTHEVRLGSVKAAVWSNPTETGVRHNVTFSRLYKDGDNWKSSDSFGLQDLLVVAKVADQAHSWIHQKEQEESRKKQPPAETTETHTSIIMIAGRAKRETSRLPLGSTGGAFHNSSTTIKCQTKNNFVESDCPTCWKSADWIKP